MSTKICTVATSEDGDKIYCMCKYDGKTLAKGLYDFNKHTFIITEFYANKLTPEQSTEEIIREFKRTLDIDFDWELKDEERLIENINEGMLRRKKKRNKRRR